MLIMRLTYNKLEAKLRTRSRNALFDDGSFPRNSPPGKSIHSMDKDSKTDQPSPQSSEKKPVDLSILEDFDFGTNWSETTRSKPSIKRSGPRRTGPPRERGDQLERRDRRGFKPGSFLKNTGDEKGQSRPRKQLRPPHRPEPPKRVVEVAFYPEDNGFQALCKALKSSSITYELFEIARIILQKDERYYMIIRPLEVSANPVDPGQEWLYVGEVDGLPFLEESAAIRHAIPQCLDYFFICKTVEVEPPKGAFNFVQKCGITGELLGPPNYHRYKQIVKDHHAGKLSKVPFEKFESRIETVKDQTEIQAWLEKMKTMTTYTLKPEFGGKRVFEEAESARAYVMAHLKDKLVRSVKSMRLEGSQARNLVDPLIKSSVEFAKEQQRRFPLYTANLLRGRLRRQNFALYKKGAKGVSYVCAVKRKFRDPDQSFSDRVQKLIEVLEANPGVLFNEFREKYLGFATHGKAGEPVTELTKEQEEQVNALSVDFKWLLNEGYVSEYADGTVIAHPPKSAVSKAKGHTRKKEEGRRQKAGRQKNEESEKKGGMPDQELLSTKEQPHSPQLTAAEEIAKSPSTKEAASLPKSHEEPVEDIVAESVKSEEQCFSQSRS